jgi:hypothetical protein
MTPRSTRKRARWTHRGLAALGASAWLALVVGAGACGPLPTDVGDADIGDGGASSRPDGSPAADRNTIADAAVEAGADNVVSGARVVEFTPGEGAGFGQSRMPDIVLGPPEGAGDMRGGSHVVSLGRGGRICLAMRVPIVDRPGPDLVVFENPFTIAGSAVNYVELGEVSVSEDGQHFTRFACDRAPPYRGCAGVTPVYAHTGSGLSPSDPRYAGGDAFDLRDVGLSRASIVCVTDLETQPPGPPSTGFDLDAIVAIHSENAM